MIGVGVGPHDVPDDVGSELVHGVGSDRDHGDVSDLSDLGNYLSLHHVAV